MNNQINFVKIKAKMNIKTSEKVAKQLTKYNMLASIIMGRVIKNCRTILHDSTFSDKDLSCILLCLDSRRCLFDSFFYYYFTNWEHTAEKLVHLED